jgi:hypothetical protein
VLRRSAPILVLGLAAASAALAVAPSYRPPLDSALVPVSSFGEYRPDHLHPGVDLSTGGRIGLPVFAIADGVIYRLKVEWRGYGRALYLRHADGRISVYAHLDRFEEKVLGLESRVADARRARSTRYPGDIYLDPPVPVHRGQQIAASGESGAGLPHLHFELRREEQRPADPSPALGKLRPSLSLRFESLFLLPMGEETLVQGERRAEVRLVRDKSGQFVPSTPVMVTGSFLPEASVVVEDASGHRFGVSGISTRVDGRLIYRSLLRDFRFDEYPQVGLLLDHALSSMSPSLFTYRLARLPGNELGKSPEVIETPFPDLHPGSHLIEVDVTGSFGGTARARIPFRLVAAPQASWSEEKSDGKQTRLSLRWGEPAQGTGGSYRVTYARAGTGTPVPCRDRRPLAGGESCSFEPVDVGAGLAATLLLGEVPVARTLRLTPRTSESSPPPATLRVRPGLGTVDFEISPASPASPLPSRLIFRQGGREVARELQMYRAPSLEAALSLTAWRDVQEVELEWPALPHPLRSPVGVIPHVGDPRSPLSLRDCGVRLEVSAASFYSATALACESEENPLPPPADRILPRSPVVRFFPQGLPLASKARLELPLPEGIEHPERVGIYRVDPDRKTWTFLGGESKDSGMTLGVGRLDSYALGEDSSPPTILEVVPAGGPLSNASPRFTVLVEDGGSGLNYDGVHLQIDGTELEMEFDPDRNRATGEPSRPLQPGIHVVSLWAVDRAGNRTGSQSFQLTVP